MSVSLRVTGTWAELTADGSVAIPATPQAGDRMYLFARWKDFSVTATVANWTELEEFADGASSSGNGTGSVKVACWYRDWQPGDTDPTIDFSASPTNASVVIMVMQKGADDVWLTPVSRTAAMTNWTTSAQSVAASATVTIPSSGVVMGLIGIRDDSATMTRPTNGIDDSGALITWNGNYVESPATHHSTTTGDDGAADLGYRLVTTGAAGVTLRMTGTISAAETGAALWVVQGVSVRVTPAMVTLTSSQFAPQLKWAITPATVSLIATSLIPQLREALTPAQVTLVITSLAPSLDTRVTPSAVTLTITLFVPQLQEALVPATVTFSMATFTSVLNETVIPATAALSLSVFAPALAEVIIIPNVSLTVTLSRPHVLPFNVMFLDPGGDATHTVGHFNQLVPGFGTDVTYDATQQVTGAGSYRFDSNTNEAPAVRILNVLSDQRRISWYWRYDSAPDVLLVADPFAELTTEVDYSGGGLDAPESLAGDDGLYATAAPARNAGQGTAYGGFGFAFGELGLPPTSGSIPVGAVIDSVRIIYERKYDVDTSIGISRVKWRLDGEEGPDHDNTDMPLVDTVVEVDVTGDRFWERKDLVDGVFEVVAEARRGDTDTAHIQSWDYVKVEVVYHPANTILAIATNGDAQLAKVAVIPRGAGVALQLLDAAGNVFTGITTLLPNADYRLALAYSHRGADNLDAHLYVNGIPELAVEEMNTVNVGPPALTRIYYGWLVNPGVDHVAWFSHIAIDAGDDLQDPGNLLETAKLPATVNDDEFDTTGGTGAVDERPLSTTNYTEHAAFTSTPTRQNYTLQDAATGDVDISGETFIGYMCWAWARSFDPFQISLTVNGADVDRTAQLSGTPALLRHAVADTSYPSNARGIGLFIEEQEAETRLYECGAVVAYQGPLHPDILLPRTLVANETLTTIIDDLRADPPDSYEVCCDYDDFDGAVHVAIESLDQDGGSIQQQPSLDAKGRVRITPGVEVHLDVTVTGVTMLTIWRRLNVD